MVGIGSVVKQKMSDMRHRITVQSPASTIDADGQPIVTWSNFASGIPARFTPTGGTETMRGKQLEAGTKGVFTVNYRDGYTTQMRVAHNGINYGITHVNEVGGIQRFIEIVVKL